MLNHWGTVCVDSIGIQLFRGKLSEKVHPTINPEKLCGWFWVHCSSEKFERMAREAMNVCLPVLKESNKSKVWQLQCQEQCFDHLHITFRGYRVHILSDSLSRKSCIRLPLQLYNHLYKPLNFGVRNLWLKIKSNGPLILCEAVKFVGMGGELP